MVTSGETQKRILEAIDRHHSALKAFILGTTPEDSLLRLAYYHSFLTPPDADTAPQTLTEARTQIRRNSEKIPTGEAVATARESTDAHLDLLIGNLAASTKTKISTLIRENNEAYHRDSLQHPTRTDIQDELIKESTLGGLKEKLRATAPKASNNWRRITLTELSDAVGGASVDRIVDDKLRTEGSMDAREVYVFRIPVNDSATCVFCRRFYGDAGEIPKVYRLSTLLGNGSNVGAPKAAWKPVVGATHPNTRTSQIIELPPGYVPSAGGSMEFVGVEKAAEWIRLNSSN